MTEQTDLRGLLHKATQHSHDYGYASVKLLPVDAEAIAAALERLEALEEHNHAILTRVERLDSERAEWIEAWDRVRDTILNDYGPLEIDEILSTIDYHDPRTAAPAPAGQQGGSDDPENTALR